MLQLHPKNQGMIPWVYVHLNFRCAVIVALKCVQTLRLRRMYRAHYLSSYFGSSSKYTEGNS